MIRSPMPRKYQRAGSGSGETPAPEPRVLIFTPALPGSTVVLCEITLHEPTTRTSRLTPPTAKLRPVALTLARALAALVWKSSVIPRYPR